MVQRAVDRVDVLLRVELQSLDQLGDRPRRRIAGHLEAHGVAAVAAAVLHLDRQEKVVGHHHVEHDVEVAGDAEDVEPLDAHARKDGRRVAGDEVLEQDERAGRKLSALRADAAHRRQTREHRRDLDDAEPRLVRTLAHEHDAEVQTLVSHLRERVARVDRDRREDQERPRCGSPAHVEADEHVDRSRKARRA